MRAAQVFVGVGLRRAGVFADEYRPVGDASQFAFDVLGPCVRHGNAKRADPALRQNDDLFSARAPRFLGNVESLPVAYVPAARAVVMVERQSEGLVRSWIRQIAVLGDDHAGTGRLIFRGNVIVGAAAVPEQENIAFLRIRIEAINDGEAVPLETGAEDVCAIMAARAQENARLNRKPRGSRQAGGWFL